MHRIQNPQKKHVPANNCHFEVGFSAITFEPHPFGHSHFTVFHIFTAVIVVPNYLARWRNTTKDTPYGLRRYCSKCAVVIDCFEFL